MFKLLNWIFKIALLLIVVALLLDFKYQGTSARTYASDLGWKVASLVWSEAKKLKGKELSEIPKSLPDLPNVGNALKQVGEKVTDKLEGKDKPSVKTPEKSNKTKEENPPQDHLTQKDKEELKKLIQTKSKS